MDLSAVYLDILKDRLYTFRADSPLRRGSQTVLFEIVVAMTKLDGAGTELYGRRDLADLGRSPARKVLALTQCSSAAFPGCPASMDQDVCAGAAMGGAVRCEE